MDSHSLISDDFSFEVDSVLSGKTTNNPCRKTELPFPLSENPEEATKQANLRAVLPYTYSADEHDTSSVTFPGYSKNIRDTQSSKQNGAAGAEEGAASGDSGSVVPYLSALDASIAAPTAASNAAASNAAPSARTSGSGISYLIPNPQNSRSNPRNSLSNQQVADVSSVMSMPRPRQNRDSYDEYSDFHKQLTLHPYQEHVVVKSLRGENDIILLPTGTGKTYVAIKIIIEHLYARRMGQPKVVFFVPTAVLAQQQLEKIKEHMAFAWLDKCRKITGEDNIPAEQLRDIIKEDEFAVLVVTPAIIGNYFAMCSEASISDFTLFIFDEYHHAKKDHPYNVLIGRCLDASKDVETKTALPQLVGMTATIGIGDSSNLEQATDFIMDMCAKFNLKSPPIEPEDLNQLSNRPVEQYVPVEHRRNDAMSRFLQDEIMEKLEIGICERFDMLVVASDKFKALGVETDLMFPKDRLSQSYEQYVVNLKTDATTYHMDPRLQEDIQYCMVALEHLNTFYKALQLNSLLYCEHGLRFIETELESKPVYSSLDSIWRLYKDNKEEMTRLQKMEDGDNVNEKIEVLTSRLENQLLENPDSKIIIFVQMRVVAKFMADLMNKKDPGKFKAKEFTSEGPSAEDAGMKPQDRLDAREGFENNKYNILVSTSVLEEGIDIQVCNVVVRYMYIKDMIAKIQSRGRARHANAILLTLLDAKLMSQERRNDHKERLMYQALMDIRGMTEEEFQSKIQQHLTKLMTPKKPTIKLKGPAPLQAVVKCKVCGKELGYMSQVRKFGMSHFLIMDGALHEKVTPFPEPGIMKAMDGMVPYGRLICKGVTKVCGNKVGTLMKMDSGYHFGMWYIKGITVNDKPLKKYKQVTDVHQVVIEPITLGEIIDLGDECQFPAELLQYTDQ